MPQHIKLWEIRDGDNLYEIKKAKLNLEERIEDWLTNDISIISDDLLVIGRQVETDFGGLIDLLCLDREGNLVIVELKRDKTPREITAQCLDYASWVKDLSSERITDIARKYLGDAGRLKEAFEKRFGTAFPETLNERHKILIVASEIDASSERIIKYLSDTYGVAINAVTFEYFRDGNARELLARVFLIEPSQVEDKSKTATTSKRPPPLSRDELRDIAERHGVIELYQRIVEGLEGLFDQTGTTRSSIAFIGSIEGRNTIFSLIPEESNADDGLRFQVYITRLCKYFGLDEASAVGFLPKHKEEWKYYKGAPPDWCGYAGFFKDIEEIDKFLTGLRQARDKV